jgi:hypothetical protein
MEPGSYTLRPTQWLTVFHAGSAARAARIRIRSIAATCHPTRVLTLSPAFCTVPGSFDRLSYHASVPYSSDGSTHVVTALRKAAAGGPWLVFARLRRWRATLCAVAIRVSTCRLVGNRSQGDGCVQL